MRQLLFCLLLVWSGASSCQEKPTAENPYALVKAETALQKLISLEILDSNAEEVFAEISQATGVPLGVRGLAGWSDLSVFIKEKPAADVLIEISELLGLGWEPKDGGGLSAHLTTSLESAAERLRRAARREALDKIVAKKKAYLQATSTPEGREAYVQRMRALYKKMLSLGDEATAVQTLKPEEIEEMMEVGVSFASSSRALQQSVLLLGPPQLDALASGKKVLFSTAGGRGALPLPPDLAYGLANDKPDESLMRDILKDIGVFDDFAAESSAPVPPKERRFSSVQLEMWMTAEGDGPMWQAALKGKLKIEDDEPTEGRDSMDQIIGMASIGTDVGSLFKQYFSKPEEVKTDDPVLSRQIDLTYTNKEGGKQPPIPDNAMLGGAGRMDRFTTADVLAQLARAANISFVCDGYGESQPEFSLGKVTLAQALAKLAVSRNLQWEQQGDFFRFRHKMWFFEMLSHIPNRLSKKWVEEISKAKGLTLDVLLEMSQLSKEQRQKLWSEVGGKLGPELTSYEHGQPQVRLWFGEADWILLAAVASLPAPQRTHLSDGKEIPVSKLPLAGRVRLDALQEEEQSLSSKDLREARLRLKIGPVKKLRLREEAALTEDRSSQWMRGYTIEEEELGSTLEWLKETQPYITKDDFVPVTANQCVIELLLGEETLLRAEIDLAPPK
jgi:hypothetical protein